MRGSIHKRGATYSIVYRVSDPATGKTKQVWRGGFATKKAAEDELKETVRTIDQGVYIAPTKQTFGEYLKDDWLPSLDNLVAGGKLKPTTASFYRNLTNSHVIPRLGGVPLKALDAPQLNACYRDLLKSGKVNSGEGLSPTTVHSIHVAISKALGDAVKWGKVARNVASLADGPRPGGSKRDVWSPEQLRTFLAFVAKDRLYALWLLAATTGMRRGELCGLRWEDLDLEAGRLNVSQTRVSVGYEVVTTSPKSASSSRAIGLDPATVAALKGWKRQQTKERLAWGPGWTDTGLVFGKEDGAAHHPRPRHPSVRPEGEVGRPPCHPAPRCPPRIRHRVPRGRRPAQGAVRAPGALLDSDHRRHVPTRTPAGRSGRRKPDGVVHPRRG